MKISILLPYKENFSPTYAGAVSLFIKETLLRSKYKNVTEVFGFTQYKKKYNLNYKNINIVEDIFGGKTKDYINKFIKYQIKSKSELVEIHNRPKYVKYLSTRIKAKIALYFHNDPLTMNGSSTIKNRLELIKLCDVIIFNSEWSYKQFMIDLTVNDIKNSKLLIIKQSASLNKIDISNMNKYEQNV